MLCPKCSASVVSLATHAKTCAGYANAAIDDVAGPNPFIDKTREYTARKLDKRRASNKCLRCGGPKPCQCYKKYTGGVCKCGAQCSPRAFVCAECRRAADFERYRRNHTNARTYQKVDFDGRARALGFTDMYALMKARRDAGVTYTAIAREVGVIAPATIRMWANRNGIK